MRMVIQPQKEDRRNKNGASRTFCLPGCLCLVQPSARSQNVTLISRAQGPNNRSLNYFQVPVPKGKVFSGGSVVKNAPAMQETWVRSLGWEDPPGGGNGNPLQNSCLGNLMDRGAWQATVRGVTKESDTTKWLNNNDKSNGKNLESPVSAANLRMLPGFLEVGNMGNRLFSAYLSQEMKCCPTQMGCHDLHDQTQPTNKSSDRTVPAKYATRFF